MSKIKSAEKIVFQTLRIGSDIDMWRKDGVFSFSDVIKCINASQEQCRNATLEVAAKKAKAKVEQKPWRPVVDYYVDKDSILDLKDSPDLKIN